MDRRRALSPVYTRQYSNNSTNSSSNDSGSPAMSPAHPSSRFGTVKRTQNVAAKAAARRLAQVMATQTSADDDDDDDIDDGGGGKLGGDDGSRNAVDLGLRFGVPPSILPKKNSSYNGFASTASSRPTNRAPSPSLGRNYIDHNAHSVRSTSAGRSATVRQPPAVQPSKVPLRTPAAIPPIDLPAPKTRTEKRLPEFGHLNLKDPGSGPEDASLLDELDMLQQENENVLEQLREAQRKRGEAEARANELERQVVHLNKRKWIEETTYPRFTMIGQSLGSVYLAWEALCKFTPVYFIDTSGYAFTYPLARLFGCKVICYTNYPTISLDMVSRVRERSALYNNDASIARS